MEIRARTKASVIVLDLFGKIDVDAANLVEAVGQCVRDGYVDVIFNFEEVEFIDYLGVSAIALAYREIVNYNGRLKFVNIPTHLKNIFSVTGLDRVIDIFPTEEMALSVLKEDKVIENIKKMQLRRRFKRLPLDIKVELKNKYERSPTCLKVDILNLSAIGAYIFGCGKFKLGDEVILKFKLPPKNEELEVEAKVVWLPDKQIQLHLQPGMGVEFVHLTPAIQDRIIEFIDRNVSSLSSDED
ncbi:MAG: anti-sigma factor antagonist [Candidatus Omnitrophica bacterium]|nr:anti-sigma factor antagonist [Candidatus Omnitrophota bacterium]